jgi:hypothetical protein
MGWRDREYAKWTDEERRRFYGSGTPGYRRGPSYSVPGQGRLFGTRVGAVPGALLAVIVSLLVALTLGQLPRSHPLIPALHFTLPGFSSTSLGSQTGKISLPSSLQFGSFLTLHGHLRTGETGAVTVEGAYDQAAMQVLATVPAQNGSYAARIRLQQRGLLHLRVTYPDGHRSVGSAEVR